MTNSCLVAATLVLSTPCIAKRYSSGAIRSDRRSAMEASRRLRGALRAEIALQNSPSRRIVPCHTHSSSAVTTASRTLLPVRASPKASLIRRATSSPWIGPSCKWPERSLGLASFSVAQRDALEDALRERAGTRGKSSAIRTPSFTFHESLITSPQPHLPLALHNNLDGIRLPAIIGRCDRVRARRW